jgi:putative transcriptional regulator
MRVNRETMIAIPADPNDPGDRDVSFVGVERSQMGGRRDTVRGTAGEHKPPPNAAHFPPLDAP